MKNQEIHHDLAYVIQKGMNTSGLEQGLNFSPTSILFSLPGNAYLRISAKTDRLKFSLEFLEKQE